MISRDYIIRMFSMLAQFLARVLFQKQIRNYDAALAELDRAGNALLGFDIAMFEQMPLSSLKPILSTDPEILKQKLIVSGILLKEKSEILQLKGNEEVSVGIAVKSLEVLLEELPDSPDSVDARWATSIDGLLIRLKEYVLPLPIMKKLIDCFELRGRFDKLDDAVFELLDIDPAFVGEATAVYERLLARTDAELESGKLPRVEVREALDAIRARFPEAD